MSEYERKRYILNELKDKGKIEVGSLSELLRVTPMTIRRDLDALALDEALIRIHGGALRKEDYQSFSKKSISSPVEKQQIGKLAATLVDDHDIIFLDCGSTALEMSRFLAKRKGIRVITNSLPVLKELQGKSDLQVVLIGGELDHKRHAIHGSVALDQIMMYHANKAFVGADAVSLDGGIMSHGEVEMSNSQAMIKSSDQAILLCDSSKFEKNTYIKMAEWSEIDQVVTDKRLSADLKSSYRANGILITY
ncbi:MAG: DeoR/GlpR transcriptional regulator [Cyclobacteriaceae bacterium]|nr:DeoR/GlpR transcriptional regulator [Cyclobacteriaceae bacterium HetDA_MAG_MS6]